ncbi:MAG: hypothetical protein JRI52_02925 [Deltaproteobacteria bacterium]|nr:hypothetical protein [Deltaproteobacteria bacterium]
MNFYDLQTLVKLGSVVQWMAIILIFLGVSLQISKFVIDKRIGDIRDQMVMNRTAKYEETLTTLKSKIIQQNRLLQKRKDKIKPLLIPQTLISKMTTHLSKYKEASVRITCVREDQGALSFSEQLKSVFQNAGWTVNGVDKATFSKPLKLVVLVLNKKEQKPKANYMFSVLKSLELKGVGKLNKDQEEDLGIIIGTKD